MKKVTIDRRRFIKITSLSSGGLVIGFMLNGFPALASAPEECEFFQPNAYLKIDKKGKVTVYVAKQESGQGVDTALPMIVAEELDAHIHALLKLRKGQPSRNETDCYHFGQYTLDAAHATLRNNKNGEKTVLSRREAGILRLLAQNKNQVVKRGAIVSHNWETQDENDYFISRSLDTYLVKLRKCLEDDPTVSIKTVRGVGLMLVEE